MNHSTQPAITADTNPMPRRTWTRRVGPLLFAVVVLAVGIIYSALCRVAVTEILQDLAYTSTFLHQYESGLDSLGASMAQRDCGQLLASLSKTDTDWINKSSFREAPVRSHITPIAVNVTLGAEAYGLGCISRAEYEGRIAAYRKVAAGDTSPTGMDAVVRGLPLFHDFHASTLNGSLAASYQSVLGARQVAYQICLADQMRKGITSLAQQAASCQHAGA